MTKQNPTLNIVHYQKLIDDHIHQKIASFAVLPRGWWYGRGDQIDATVLARAKQMVRYLKAMNLNRFEAFPSPDGEVLVSAGISGQVFAEVLCCIDGSYDIEITNERDVIFEEYGVDVLFVLTAIMEQSWKMKSSTDSFIQFITVMNKNVSPASPSSRPVTDVQLSALNAPRKRVVANARIFANITEKKYAGNRQSFAA